MVRKILIGILLTVLVLTIVGFLLPREFKMEKSIAVTAPRNIIFNEINTLTQWQKWNYWNQQDSAMEISFSPQPSGAGAFYSWKSTEMGDGKLTISRTAGDSLIDVNLEFMENNPALNWFRITQHQGSSTLTIGFKSDFGMNPFMRLIGNIFLGSEMEKAFDHNLTALKKISEAKTPFPIDLTVVTTQSFRYIGIRSKVATTAAIDVIMKNSFTALAKALTIEGIKAGGSPFAVYPVYRPDTIEFICGIPIPDGATVRGYKPETFPAQTAINLVHKGNWTSLPQTYQTLIQYATWKGLQETGPAWEVYLTDPELEKDTARWLTSVYIPVNGK